MDEDVCASLLCGPQEYSSGCSTAADQSPATHYFGDRPDGLCWAIRSTQTLSRHRFVYPEGKPHFESVPARFRWSPGRSGAGKRLLKSRGVWLALGRAILPPGYVHASQRELDQRSVVSSTFRIERRGVTQHQAGCGAASNRTRMEDQVIIPIRTEQSGSPIQRFA
jgi:hypothetical protein